ncbi:MICOS complex subunit MIC60, mitochondrial [Prosopis cineraria]|uniref:MICOS complex subunit MIC60, mitochondrial n=1 Tax=Prosopis cineraria TaxID=364024 RepID=UPI002410AE28|nr:MICOS complex subunit MIC60, mitochondrial [Prosopis cineraria]XP_054821998.1 MICOS complex subunit MIC60, mitochondrial [Prosopis cineraria]
MLRRSILEISSRRTLAINPRHFTNRAIPSRLSLRKKFSTASKLGGASIPGSTGKPPESQGSLSKFVIGSFAVGAAFLAAYQTGYLDQYLRKAQRSVPQDVEINATNEDSKTPQHSVELLVSPSSEKLSSESPSPEPAEQKMDAQLPVLQNLTEDVGDNQIQVQDKSDNDGEGTVFAKKSELPEFPQSNAASDNLGRESLVQPKEIDDMSRETDTAMGLEGGTQQATTSTFTTAGPDEKGVENNESLQQVMEERREDTVDNDLEQPSPLLEEYHLRDKDEKSAGTFLSSEGFTENSQFYEEKEALSCVMEGLKDGYISKDGKVVLDFLQAIHAAEKRQADLDARVFNEEKKMLREKYEKRLKDAAARELMRAEEAAMLDKELKRERAKAALAIKSLQEKMEEKLKIELEQKESEAEMKLKKVRELAEAELNAAIANEKSAQLEKLLEAYVDINALSMAFYARSEEARQSHAANHFSMGALALEDALSKGLPIHEEVASLKSHLEGVDKDSVLELVLASLPEETKNIGTDTQLLLKQKFDSLKGAIRHFSFFPPGGGGMLAHSLAHVACWLKVREADQSGDGIESIINRVEFYLAEGKLAEAADVLEESVRGTQAAEIVADWVRQARNRAISEQALALLQSYASSISLT